MLAANLSEPPILEGLRAAFRASRPGVVLVPAALDATTAAGLRELVGPKLKPVELADRGRYATGLTPPTMALVEELRRFAEPIAGAPLAVVEARWLLFRDGDYALFKDGPPLEADVVEAVLDLSAAPVVGGEIVYARGRERLVALPASPLAVALVERPAGSVRQTRYLPRKQGPAELYRLRVTLSR